MAVVGETGVNEPRHISRTCSGVFREQGESCDNRPAMAALPLPDLEQMESLMFCASELLEDTPDPDLYGIDTERIAASMYHAGRKLGAALNCTGAQRAETLARALAKAHRRVSRACRRLESDYDYECRTWAQPPVLLRCARDVLGVLEQARDAAGA